jgi:hypothetical protein
MTINRLGTGSAYDPLASMFSAGADLGTTPKLDGTDVWPFMQGSTVSLPASYLVDDTWVSGAGGKVTLTLTLAGATIALPVEHAIVSMKLDPHHERATGGVLAGVIATTDLTSAFTKLIAFDPKRCLSPNIQGIAPQLTQASDMMQDGTEDPSATCDGASVGLGSDAALVQLGAAVPAPPPPPNPYLVDGGP